MLYFLHERFVIVSVVFGGNPSYPDITVAVYMSATNDIFGRKHNFRKTQLLLPIFKISQKFPQVKMGLPSEIEI